MTQPPPQQTTAQQDTQLAIAAAGQLAVAVSVAAAVASLGALFAAAGITGAALSGALSVVMGMPPDAKGFYGPATSSVTRLNLVRRAQFTVASARRVQGALVAARSADQPLGRALADAVTAERRYYGQHLMASWGRDNAAARVDSESMTYGRLLGWYTVLDSRTSAECRAANRHNFYADQMPRIGYPGMVHPACRCLPGPPVPGAPMVGSSKARIARRQHAYA